MTAATGGRWRREKAILFSMTRRLSKQLPGKREEASEKLEKPKASEKACIGSGQPPEEKGKLLHLPE